MKTSKRSLRRRRTACVNLNVGALSGLTMQGVTDAATVARDHQLEGNAGILEALRVLSAKIDDHQAINTREFIQVNGKMDRLLAIVRDSGGLLSRS
jgi:hypothetical protein